MTSYKHTQIGYLMIFATIAALALFAWTYITALAEPPSYHSGSNLPVTAMMIAVLFILASFTTLTVLVDKNYLRIKFGYGIFRKKFPINEIISVTSVKNHWYYGWGIRFWPWSKMWIYNVSGFNAIEITMRSGKIYRIGTDDPNKLEATIKRAINN